VVLVLSIDTGEGGKESVEERNGTGEEGVAFAFFCLGKIGPPEVGREGMRGCTYILCPSILWLGII
jgi:hypothetical protein